MDAHTRAIGRQVRAAPGDLGAARRYRAALERLAAGGDPEAAAELDHLTGVFVETTSRAVDLGPPAEARSLPFLRRVGLGRDAPLLAPAAPSAGAALALQWRARGRPLLVGAGCLLLEAPDRSLEARCPRTGEVLWSVPSARPDLGDLAWRLDPEERAVALPWAVAPWGAAEVVARYHAPLRYRRVGRHDPELGRVTERRPYERGEAEVELTLTLAVPEGRTFTAAPPEQVVERSSGAEGLCDGDLTISEWDVEPDELRLCPDDRLLVVCSDEALEWAVYSLSGGGDLPTAIGPAGFAVPAEPWPLPTDRPTDGPGGSEWRVERRRLVLGDEEATLTAPEVGPDVTFLLPVDGATLVLTALPGGEARLSRIPWGGRRLEPWISWPPAERLTGCKPVSWTQAHEVAPSERATVLASHGRLLVQVEDALEVYGEEGR